MGVHGRYPDGVELDRYVVRRIREGMDYLQRRDLIRLFARFMSDLHGKGVFHADLKTCNIMVTAPDEGSAVRFSLLDYDEVKFARDVSIEEGSRISCRYSFLPRVPSALRIGSASLANTASTGI